MKKPELKVNLRKAQDSVFVIDLLGEVTSFGEGPLMEAFKQASEGGAQALIFNFRDLEFMNSGGIGLLVTVLIRANRQGIRLSAVELNEHYRRIFELTSLNEAIHIFEKEEEALAEVV